MYARCLRMRAFLFTWPHPFLLPLATYSLETDCPLGFRLGPPGLQRVPTPAPKKTQKRSSAWENLGEEPSAKHHPPVSSRWPWEEGSAGRALTDGQIEAQAVKLPFIRLSSLLEYFCLYLARKGKPTCLNLWCPLTVPRHRQKCVNY